MTNREIASTIPSEIRTSLLLTVDDPITNAVASKDNQYMKILMKIWYEYIEPGQIPDCSICINNVLTNFRQMRDALIELENEHRFLNQL